jgi:molecular chaperone GrpE
MKKEKIETLKKEKEEYLEGWKRAKAEFLNYKKDEQKRNELFLEREKENLFKEFLHVLDNFDCAEREAKKRNESDEFIDGFLKIKELLMDFLSEQGVEEMIVVDKDFDPFFHDAVEVVDGKEEDSGKIIEELQKGYLFKDRVIRPAKVKVIK